MNKQRTLLFSFWLLLSAIPIFYNLDGPAIYLFDEAIYANNALEMAQDGDPFVLKNNGEVSLYNTKPPLVIWWQSLAIKCFGPTEWAIRLPSALAAFGTVFLLLLFAQHTLQDYRIGLVAMLVLVTSPGYLRNHVARSGDLDAMLIFWITCYSLLAFDHLLRPKEAPYRRHFIGIGIGVCLAFYSKSVAGFMPLLGLALAALAQGRLLTTLRKPLLYVVALASAICCFGYYALREYLAPGYLDQVFFSEYSRFTENIMPWHEKPFWFYLDNMWSQAYFMPYLVFLPLALLLAFWQKDRLRDAAILLALFCLSYFLLISYPTVKLNYYDAPLYPFLSLVIGIGVVRIWTWGEGRFSRLKWHNGYFSLLLLLLFFFPLKNTWIKINNNAPFSEFAREGFAIRALEESAPEEKHYRVLMYSKYEELYDQANFYIKAANHFDQADIQLVHHWQEVEAGEKILCCQSYADSLRQTFVLKKEERIGDCFYFDLGRRKE